MKQMLGHRAADICFIQPCDFEAEEISTLLDQDLVSIHKSFWQHVLSLMSTSYLSRASDSSYCISYLFDGLD